VKKGLRVGIVGAGVGGLTAATALRRAGAEPTVLERAPALREVQAGGSVHLWPNALRALKHAGLYDAVRASVDEAAVLTTFSFESVQRGLLCEWATDKVALGLPLLGVVRGEIHEVLSRQVRDTIRLGAPVESFLEGPDAVEARVAGGRSDRFDVLVGADGLRSTVRAGLLGQSDPRYSGYVAWVALVRMTHSRFHQATRVSFGRGGRFTAWAVTGGRIYWEAIWGTPSGGQDGPQGRRQDVLARFGDWAASIRELIEATPEGDIRRSDSLTRPVSRRWGAGRVTLLGDAAHPMTNAIGQGANAAIEDGVVLARCLERNDDPVAGLREYETIRRPRATTFVKRSRFVARLATVRNPLLMRGRDAFVGAVFPRVYHSMRNDLAYDAGAV
jgi:2-polyprenyl-6-methoxyphenol hydroxylase-like FAD-dependent oxidoreductase